MGVLTPGREVRPLAVPTGERVRDLLPVLADVLAGRGPVRSPVAAAGPDDRPDPAPGGLPDGGLADGGLTAGGLTTGGLADGGLADGEDDPADPTALIVSTSGSTGAAKAALLPAGALRASIAATAQVLGGAGQWLLALPAEHIAGLQVLLRSVAAGTDPVVLDTARSFAAADLTAATRRLTGPRRYTSLVPTQLHRVLADPGASAALATFDAVLVGGAATSPDLRHRALAAGVRLVTTYGMSETCGGCVYDGVPLPGVRVSCDDPVDGGPGRVRITGPVVARGYRGRPGDPAFPAGGAGRTFLTSDLGRITAGRLDVAGRADDLLVSGGLKIDPAPLERLLEQLPTVAAALVVGVDDPEWGQQLVAVVEPAPGGPAPSEAQIRAALADRPAAARPRRMVLVDRLPTRGIGKPDRRAAAALAARRGPDGREL